MNLNSRPRWRGNASLANEVHVLLGFSPRPCQQEGQTEAPGEHGTLRLLRNHDESADHGLGSPPMHAARKACR